MPVFPLPFHYPFFTAKSRKKEKVGLEVVVCVLVCRVLLGLGLVLVFVLALAVTRVVVVVYFITPVIVQFRPFLEFLLCDCSVYVPHMQVAV